MSTSGSYNFSVSRDDLIKHAMLEIGQLEPGESPTAQETTDCAERLNMMVKSWIVKGYHLWAIQDAVLFMVAAQQSYSLGSGSSDAEWCAWDDYNQVELAADAAAAAGTVTVDDDDDIASADRIGVVLDDGTIHWTTVNGAPAANVVTLTSALASEAAEGNVVFTYTSRLVRPVRIVPGTLYRRDIGGADTPVELVAKPEYDMLNAKAQSGKVIKAAYQPFLSSGRLWTWQCADLATDVLRFSYERPIQDFDATTDEPDFPIEAAEAIYKNLAVKIAGMFGAQDELPRLTNALGTGEADVALEEWLSFNRDNAPLRFQPSVRR